MSHNVALGLLASKLDRGELDPAEALERAYRLGCSDSEPPPTVRSSRSRELADSDRSIRT